MTRVLNRFFIAKDHKTFSWCVLEHTNKPWGNTVKTNLTEAEAIALAFKLSEDYENALKISK